MRTKLILTGLFCSFCVLIFTQCEKEEFMDQTPEMTLKKGKPDKPTEAAGNNLSYPVIWAEGVTKNLPGTYGMTPSLAGEWWYQWGTNGSDPNITPASCPPDPDEANIELNPGGLCYCDNNVPDSLDEGMQAGIPAADKPLTLAKVFLQKDLNNTWQAGSANWSSKPVNIHWIDWGDNLESVDWYTRSQVRTEVVLFQDLNTPMVEYEMRHTSGWGIDEVHGLAATVEDVPKAILGSGMKATVYSNCARLTIQKLLVDRDDIRLDTLEWIPGEGWNEPEEYAGVDLIRPHIFNGSVHEGGDGPEYYSAEINVKGRIIYGYTWNVRKLNEGAGYYRITFSFDSNDGSGNLLNTFFKDGVTQIIVPLEEEVIEAIAIAESEEGGDEGGGSAVVDFENNLTYMDIRILERGRN